MIVLALDTAGVDCAVALYDSDRDLVLAEVTETIGKGHAERLMAVLDQVLDAAGLTLDRVERIAVTVGPGSFTGIRVGVAAARGFSLSLGVPVVGVSTLEVIAATALRQTPGRAVVAAMDAKRNEVYFQRFDRNGHAADEPQALTVEDATALAAGFDGTVVGSAARLIGHPATEPVADTFPISIVGRLGAKKPVGEKPKPLYLRGPDVKPQAGFAVARM